MLRNREFRWFVLVFLGLAAIAIAVGFALNPAAGILASCIAVAFGAAFFVFTRARYQSIARISSQIDVVLHHAEHLDLGEADEGELSILHSEITKMLLRIREQNDALKKGKEHLADALADIAHQLRTPITSVHLLLSLLANSTQEGERKAFAREAEALLARVDWLLTSLLKISRLDAGVVVFQEEPIRAKGLVASALKPLAIPMELRCMEVHLEAPEDAMIRGDLGWLSEAVQNILKNCMESAGENGSIEIVCTENPLFTEITVHDSGAGFDSEELPRLFDRFYRGKNANATGYGIGLALSQMIITRQGGTIAAVNHPQGGALFVLRFPK